MQLNSSDVSFVVADKQEVQRQILDNNGEQTSNLEFTELFSGTEFPGGPQCKLLWESDILKYFFIHINLNPKLIR